MVTAVTEGGKAAQAGVKAGDVLVSIDGKKGFNDQSADTVHASLSAPVMLVFMGFVGKLQAEVRLNYKQKVCGLSSQHQVIVGRPESPVQVVDEVVFQPATATLFLATVPPGTSTRHLGAGQFGRRSGPATGAAGDDCEDDGVGDEGMCATLRELNALAAHSSETNRRVVGAAIDYQSQSTLAGWSSGSASKT